MKGSDYLGDQDTIEQMCHEAVEVVLELERMGLPFSRTEEGRIAQRRFGGHSHHFGEGPVRRSCYAADRTGHMILQTLYQQCIRHKVEFYDEFHVLDLILSEGRVAGVVAYEVLTGDIHIFRAKAVLFATGGFGRMFSVTSNALAFTGDGPAIVLRRGLLLEDMEFFQFHPTGIRKLGILITEGVRGEGGILRNDAGEAFMERYAPTMKDLASRDVVSRAMYSEVEEGRGIGGSDYLYLDATHLGREVIETKLPDIADFCRTYLGVDPVVEPMPVQPTAHYAMGGIPTDINGRVISDERNTVVPGLYAAGECACVSVHGANRLGTNSLVDIIVFGRRAGRDMARFARGAELPALPESPAEGAIDQIEQLLAEKGDARPADIRTQMQRTMMNRVGVFREENGLRKAVEELEGLKERFAHVRVQDKGRAFNTDLLEAWELGALLDLALVTATCALNRTESRGAHSREDYPDRNDVDWLKHTLAAQSEDGDIRISYKPVTITKFEPKERVY